MPCVDAHKRACGTTLCVTPLVVTFRHTRTRSRRVARLVSAVQCTCVSSKRAHSLTVASAERQGTITPKECSGRKGPCVRVILGSSSSGCFPIDATVPGKATLVTRLRSKANQLPWHTIGGNQAASAAPGCTSIAICLENVLRGLMEQYTASCHTQVRRQCLCACVCGCARVCVFVCACARVCVMVGVCVCGGGELQMIARRLNHAPDPSARETV